MAVPFLSLHRDYTSVLGDVRVRFERVLDSQVFVLGPETAALEEHMRTLCKTRYAVACSSGTEALVLALLGCGVGPGDAVVVPAYTFFASAGAVCRVGARPVFADIDGGTFNMGPRELARVLEREFLVRGGTAVHRASGARLRAVIAVHLFGRAADLGALAVPVRDVGAVLIEDAAQAIGASSAGHAVGSIGAAGCFSFYPTKNIGGAGDGGAVTTDDEECARHMRRLRSHGAEPGSPVHAECGFNARMGELQAAYLNAKFPHLNEWTNARLEAASRYRERLAPLAAASRLHLPSAAPEGEHVWHQFVVRVAHGRELVRTRLSAAGIETRVFYPVPVHLQPCFAGLGYHPGDLPLAERLAGEALSLPLFASISRSEIDEVCERLAEALIA